MADLQPLLSPVAIFPENIARSETTLGAIQTSRWKRNYAVKTSPPGLPSSSLQTLCSLNAGHGFSKGFWNYSHDITDSSGQPMYEIRRQWSKENFWLLRIPGAKKGEEKILGRGGFQVSWLHLKADFTVFNAAGSGEEVAIHIRGQDSSQVIFHVLVGEQKHLAAKVFRRGVFKSDEVPTWEVKCAEGFDMVLAASIAVMIGDVVNPNGSYLAVGGGGGS